MLLEFRVQNHRSLRDEQVLSFEPSKAASTSPDAERTALPAVALYGANASGKSNVLAALAYMQSAVSLSHRMWDPEHGVPREPFAWNSNRQEPSLYEVTFAIQGVRYQYGFVADDERFQEEWLYAWPKGRKQTWFTRETETFEFGDHLKGENRLVQQVTRPNALFLSAAVQHHHEQLQPVYHWFRRLDAVNVAPGGRGRFGGPMYWSLINGLFSSRRDTRLPDVLEEGGEDALNMYRQLLRVADVGITDIKLVNETDGEDSTRTRRRSRVLMKHQNPNRDAWLPLEEESNGTRTLMTLAQPMLQTLRHGGLLIADDLGASLHPLLAAHIVNQFNDSETNPNGGQLLFTTACHAAGWRRPRSLPSVGSMTDAIEREAPLTQVSDSQLQSLRPCTPTGRL